MNRIKVIGARWDSGIRWGEELAGLAGVIRTLLMGFDRQLDENLAGVPSLLRGTARFTLQEGARALHATMGLHLGEEVDALAELAGAGIDEVVLANLAYDLSSTVGCSTFVGRSESGAPLHARSL